MAYTVNHTDVANKGSITVEDNTLNQTTSLSLPGRNTTAYGTAIAENFLHLLENFTNSYIYIYRERDRETNMSNRKIYIGGYQNENDCYDNYNHDEKVDNEYQTDNNNRRRKQRIDYSYNSEEVKPFKVPTKELFVLNSKGTPSEGKIVFIN